MVTMKDTQTGVTVHVDESRVEQFKRNGYTEAKATAAKPKRTAARKATAKKSE